MHCSPRRRKCGWTGLIFTADGAGAREGLSEHRTTRTRMNNPPAQRRSHRANPHEKIPPLPVRARFHDGRRPHGARRISPRRSARVHPLRSPRAGQRDHHLRASLPTSTLPASPPRAAGNWPRWMQASRTQPPTSFRNSRSSHEQDVDGGGSRPRYKCRRMSSFSTPFTVAIARRIAFSVPMRSGA